MINMRNTNIAFLALFILLAVATFIAAFFYSHTHQYLICGMCTAAGILIYLDRKNH